MADVALCVSEREGNGCGMNIMQKFSSLSAARRMDDPAHGGLRDDGCCSQWGIQLCKSDVCLIKHEV